VLWSRDRSPADYWSKPRASARHDWLEISMYWISLMNDEI
jgi:hypothetical protein